MAAKLNSLMAGSRITGAELVEIVRQKWGRRYGARHGQGACFAALAGLFAAQAGLLLCGAMHLHDCHYVPLARQPLCSLAPTA